MSQSEIVTIKIHLPYWMDAEGSNWTAQAFPMQTDVNMGEDFNLDGQIISLNNSFSYLSRDNHALLHDNVMG